MKRHSLIVIAAALVLLAAPSAFAQPTVPFGHFDGQVQGGNGATGVIPLAGWALDDDGVQSVDVYVDGHSAGRTTYGLHRPGVAARYPGFPDSEAAGFGFQLDTTHYLNGLHSVQALVTSGTGQQRTLNALVFEFYNAGHLLKPFGNIDRPHEDAELFGRCDLGDVRRYSVVEGWVLDVGAEEDDFGVGYVELLIDGSIFSNSRTACFPALFPDPDGLGCYGLRRLDVERAFPLIKDSPHAGFRFVMDVGRLVLSGYAQGHHVLSIRSGDIAGQVTEVDRIPVNFDCDTGLNEAAKGEIDLPEDGLFFGGSSVTITGYAVDFDAIDRVEVYVDGHLRGTATLGLPRPGIAGRYPGYPGAATAGWSYELGVADLAEGLHQLQVIVVDDEGATTLLGERTFRVHNP